MNPDTSKLLTLDQQIDEAQEYLYLRKLGRKCPTPHRPHAFCAKTGVWLGQAYEDYTNEVPFVISGVPYNKEPQTLTPERLAWLLTPRSEKTFAF